MNDAHTYPPVDTVTRSFTVRAVLTGALLGGLLSVCNVYSGLKIGWGFNMSITAVLLSFGFWGLMKALFKTPDWTILENNINQTGASAAASISSAGLVSAVPALTILDGYQFTWLSLTIWVFLCSSLGVFVAVLFSRQLIHVDKLPFASGVATARTLQEMYAEGKEATGRVWALITGAVAAAVWKLAGTWLALKPTGLGWLAFGSSESGALKKSAVASVSAHNLGFAFDPSLLMVGAGAIIGLRSGVSMLFGAIISWGFIGTWLLEKGWAKAGDPAAPWLKGIGEWLIWPGVSLLVASSMVSLVGIVPQFARAFRRSGDAKDAEAFDPHAVPTRWIAIGVGAVSIGVVVVGNVLFGMAPWIGLVAVALTGILAIVALRVSGETNITPVGPMGKVTQLTFAVLDPGNVSTNLMAANVTGGSASQAGDMIHDLKTGALIGSSPKHQMLSQLAGVVSGAIIGSAIYLVLIPDPKAMLLTPEWAAPAVASWKSVAEVFRHGLSQLPPGATWAMLVAALIGIALALAEKHAPPKIRPWIPSASGIGLAALVPANFSISFFLGGLIAVVLGKFAKDWSTRFLIVVASGVIAGESLAGAGQAFGIDIA